jgi:tetratricopeptide (TPR) repeat protein
MRRALAIDEASFGAEHPDVAIDLNNLAQLLQATNRLGEAEPLLRRAFLIFKQSLGPEHPNTQTVLNNYAGLLGALGRSREQILATLREMAPEMFGKDEGRGKKEEGGGGQQQVTPQQVRAVALDLYKRGEIARAAELFEALLQAGLDVALVGSHLARIYVLTDRMGELRALMTRAWEQQAAAPPYVVPRLVWFQLLLVVVGEKSAVSSQESEVRRLLGKLKTLVQRETSFAEWIMQPVLEHLKGRMQKEEGGSGDWELLAALVAALNDRTKLPDLDRFPAWREATPLALD